jgi:SulP family sulfate permease
MASVARTANRRLVTRLLPFLAWVGEWRDRAVVRADIIAGVTVALVLIPQSMAYAQLAGLPAYYGLYAAFLPPAIAALFGSSRQLATGPVALASLLTAATLGGMAPADSSQYVQAAILLALMVGVLRLMLGVLRLGVLVNLLSNPVVMGFTNGTAIIIATSQLHKLFGVDVISHAYHYQTVWYVCSRISVATHWPTVLMALFTLAVLFGLRIWKSRLPYVLIAAVIATIVSRFSGFTGAVVGEIPRGLPPVSVPHVDFALARQMLPGALTIVLLGLMEAMSIAKAIAVRTRQRIDIDQELIGQGMSNIVGSVTSSYAVSGSFSRSAVNFNSGAVTGMSSVVTSLVVGVSLLWFTPLLYFLPHCALAAIILAAVISLVRVQPIVFAWRVHPSDGIVAIVTFVLTLALAPHLHWAIAGGVGLSVALYLIRTMRPRVAVLSRHQDGTLRDADVHALFNCKHIAIIRFDAGLYFINCGYFEDKVLEVVADMSELKCVIVDAGGMNRIDSSGEQMLFTVVRHLRELGVDVCFSRVKDGLMHTFTKTGFVELVGPDRFFRWNQHAIDFAWGAMHCDHMTACPLYGALSNANHDAQAHDDDPGIVQH